MEQYFGETMNSIRTAQQDADFEARNYWNAVTHAAELIRIEGMAEQNAITQAAEKFGLREDEVLPMSEAIDNILREQIEQEHQPSDDWEP